MDEAIIVTEEAPYRLNQIRTNEKYEIFAKSWTCAVVTMIAGKLYVDAIHQPGADIAGGSSN
ncbi:hypothetical protein Hanom_Chr03g00202871 [Helianthus anomalus]